MKYFSTILLLAFLLSTDVFAHDFEVDGIYYNINGDQATVTFRGAYNTSFSDEYFGDVIVPESVTYNGKSYSVTSIGWTAFYDCHSLRSINIPKTVTTIGSNAFGNCPELAVITVVNNNPKYYSNNYNVIIEKTYKKLIAGCKNSIIPDNITSIGESAFLGCSGLTYVNIPNTVTSIGQSAFYGCTGLTNILIPSSVTNIGNSAFYGCSGLESITVENDNPKYDSRNNCNAIVESQTNTLVFGCQNTIIPNSVTSVFDFAFKTCFGLTSIEIPNSVKSIGYAAFSDCTNLTSIEIPNSMTSIGQYAFDGCTNLINISIPSSVTYIGEYAFRNTRWYNNQPNGLIYAGLVVYGYKGNMPYGTNIIIEDGTLGIAGSAFRDCTGLASIDIPNSVVSIGEAAFWYCSNLTCINIPNSVHNISNHLFGGCSRLTSIEIPKTVFTIGQGAFGHCTTIKTIYIGDSVSDIAFNAFQGSTSINNVYCYAQIPPNSTDQAFSNYSGTLHVPATSLAAYFTAPCWRNFENIIGDAIPPTDIIIDKDSLVIMKGEQFTLCAFVIPTNASSQNITWKSTNTNIATVNNGCVTTVGVGDCDILAFCNGMQATCHISVVEQLITITLDQQEILVLPNHIVTLTPFASPILPDGFTVSSSDPTVAAARVVNNKVQVVGIKEGTSTITVGSTDGTAMPAICLVTVYTELGDVNMDGFVTISDVTQIIDYLLSGDASGMKLENADVNGNGNVSIGDVTDLIDKLLSDN